MRPIDSIGEALTRGHSEQVPGPRVDENPDELPSERRHVGYDDRGQSRARPRASFGEGQNEMDEEREPQSLQQEAERPQAVRLCPAKVGGEERERGRNEQDPRSPPARAPECDERSGNEGPGERDVDRNART